MTTQTKIILALAAALLIGIAIASLISNAKFRSLEREVDAAKQQAKASDEAAVAAEIKAAEYKQKTEHLEKQIGATRAIARKQDEKLEKIGSNVGMARRNVSDARNKRGASSDADDLCRKLNELGHACQ